MDASDGRKRRGGAKVERESMYRFSTDSRKKVAQLTCQCVNMQHIPCVETRNAGKLSRMPKNEDWDNLARHLHAARGKRTLREVAEACGMTEGKLVNLEAGRAPKTGLSPAVFRLAGYYRWTLESVHEVLAGGEPTVLPERHWYVYVDRAGTVGTCPRVIPESAYRVWPSGNPRRILSELEELDVLDPLDAFEAAMVVCAWTRSFGWSGPAGSRDGRRK